MVLPLKKVKNRHKERISDKHENSSKIDPISKLINAYIPYNELFKEGIVAGIGWAFGVTIGFVLVSTILVFILQALGGIPLIGGWIAAVVEETQAQLIKRNPFILQ